MSNKVLVGLILGILIFLGIIFLLFTKRSPSSSLSQTKTSVPSSPTTFQLKETKIELTNTGFSPKTTTINKGEGVIWTNTSGSKATINSADHPTHKKFPEMNLGEFENGQSLTHVFMKPGTYEYHNHYNPSETGELIVK